jgi:hypothetical protein
MVQAGYLKGCEALVWRPRDFLATFVATLVGCS